MDLGRRREVKKEEAEEGGGGCLGNGQINKSAIKVVRRQNRIMIAFNTHIHTRGLCEMFIVGGRWAIKRRNGSSSRQVFHHGLCLRVI